MNVCSHQPSLLPYIGFWNKIAQCKKYIALCGVNYSHHDFQNRVKLLGAWLTLPLDHKTKNGPIDGVRILDHRYLREAATRIDRSLRIRRFKDHGRLVPIIEYLNTTNCLDLCYVNLNLTSIVMNILDIHCEVVVDEMRPNEELSKTENLVGHVLRWEKDPVYFSGPGTMRYLITEIVPFPIKVQKLKEGLSSESILQLIAEEPDPLDYIMSAATWEDAKEKSYASVCG